MWELSENHCCAACIYSHRPGCLAEANCPRHRGGPLNAESLFPLGMNLLCAYYRKNLGQENVQAVLVRPDGRCAGYECHAERYLTLYGAPPSEDEDFYGLDQMKSRPVPSTFSGLQAGF